MLGWAFAVMTAAASPSPAAATGLDAFLHDTPRCAATAKHCFGIHVHIVVTDDGPVQSPAWLTAQLEQATRLFALISTSFEVASVDALPASDLDIADRSHRDRLGHDRFNRGTVHLFVVGRLADVDIDGEEIRGVHWRERADRSKRWVILSRIAGSLVLSHELGHFFGLPHSRHAISLMNKTPRLHPPVAEWTFAPPEVKRMRQHRDAMLGDGMLRARPHGE